MRVLISRTTSNTSSVVHVDELKDCVEPYCVVRNDWFISWCEVEQISTAIGP